MKITRKARREISLIALFASMLTFMVLLIWGESGYLKLRLYRSELHQLQLHNHHLRDQHRTDLEKIEKLKNNPSEVERIARERYHYARPGDIIVNLPE